MNSSVHKLLFGILAMGLVMTSTGCMTSPGQGEMIGNRNDPVTFSGFVLGPNERVLIQAKHPVAGWLTISSARSAAVAYTYHGTSWHPWGRAVRVPTSFWTASGFGMVKTEVRAVMHPKGYALPTFHGKFEDWFNPNQSPGEMFSEHGAGSTATIYATH